MPPKCPVRETLSGMLFFRKLARQQVTHDMLWHTKFGDQVLEHSQQQGNEPQKHQLLLNLLQSLEQRILVLLLQILAEKVQKALDGQRNGDNDGADNRHHPCGSVLQRRLFFGSTARHISDSGALLPHPPLPCQPPTTSSFLRVWHVFPLNEFEYFSLKFSNFHNPHSSNQIPWCIP